MASVLSPLVSLMVSAPANSKISAHQPHGLQADHAETSQPLCSVQSRQPELQSRNQSGLKLICRQRAGAPWIQRSPAPYFVPVPTCGKLFSMAKTSRTAVAGAKAEVSKPRSTTQKRSLRVVKWIGTVPAIGVCTYCATNFNVPFEMLKRASDAQENLRKQFEEHKCERHGLLVQTRNEPHSAL
jgi:hypothetical protein